MKKATSIIATAMLITCYITFVTAAPVSAAPVTFNQSELDNLNRICDTLHTAAPELESITWELNSSSTAYNLFFWGNTNRKDMLDAMADLLFADIDETFGVAIMEEI